MRQCFILIASVALMAIPTIASAHGGNTNPNVVHACIGDVNKVVRIVGVSGTCISTPAVIRETAAHWDIQGPPGTPGTNGTNGAAGAPGINGTNGTNGTNGIDGTSVTFVGPFSGNQHGCENGGLIYAAGSPPVNAYVCNGINGGTGTATRAAGPCFDNTNRYVDCGNGTVTDTVTGLIWLKNVDCLNNTPWAAANQAAAGLKNGDCAGALTDNSSPGDWRLPTRAEWVATIAKARALACTPTYLAWTDDVGTACWGSGTTSSFVGLGDLYWSSSTNEDYPDNAWVASLVDQGPTFGDPHIFRLFKLSGLRVWPVRGGPR